MDGAASFNLNQFYQYLFDCWFTGVWDKGISMPSLPTLLSENCILASNLTTSELSSKPLNETAVVTFKLSQSGVCSALLKLVVSKQVNYFPRYCGTS